MFRQDLKIDEDDRNEFKMHSKNVLPEISKSKYERNKNGRIMRLNQPNSKVICAFLNTKGGRLFLGVNDNGRITGLKLTEFQLDHAILSLNHTLESFTPPVPANLIRFNSIKLRKTEEDSSNYDEISDVFLSEAAGTLEHVIGKPFCYCSNTSDHQASQYLIIITVERARKNIWYQNEEGLVYIRRNGSNMLLTMDTLRLFEKNLFTSECSPFPIYKLKMTIWDHLFENFLQLFFSIGNGRKCSPVEC
ncbi:unnamed protein product [Auanema sp. JU1783]|nr:unnamed protein product [Auanema sp. JU1783]